jgi:hypothetical protein
MNDSELDDMLSTWKAPEVSASMRAGLRLRFPVKPPRPTGAGQPRVWRRRPGRWQSEPRWYRMEPS